MAEKDKPVEESKVALCHHCHQHGYTDCDLQQKIKDGGGPPCNNCNIFIKTGHPKHQCYANAGKAVFGSLSNKSKKANKGPRNYKPHNRNAFYSQQWMPLVPTAYTPVGGFYPHVPQQSLWNPYQQYQQPPTPRAPFQPPPFQQPVYQPSPSRLQQSGMSRDMRKEQKNKTIAGDYPEISGESASRDTTSPHTKRRIEDLERENDLLKSQLKEHQNQSTQDSKIVPQQLNRSPNLTSVEELDSVIKAAAPTIGGGTDTETITQPSNQAQIPFHDLRHDRATDVDSISTYADPNHRERRDSPDRRHTSHSGDRSRRDNCGDGDDGGVRLAKVRRTNLDSVGKYGSDRC